MKPCFVCKKILPLSDFYAHPKMPDGHLNKCKECHKEAIRKRRAERADYYRAYDAVRETTPRRKRLKAKQRDRWRSKNKVKVAAHNAVQRALTLGNLVRSKICQKCSKPNGRTRRTRLHAHHDDYSQPLAVRWLCVRCHHAAHNHLTT